MTVLSFKLSYLTAKVVRQHLETTLELCQNFIFILVTSFPHTSLSLSIQAEARAEFAERSVQKLQKEVDRLEGE